MGRIQPGVEPAIGRLHRLGGSELVARVIDLFLEHAPERIGQMRRGFASEDLSSVEASAHSLKSSAANLGLDGMADLAGRIERLAAASQDDPLPELIEELEVDFARARRSLASSQRGLAAP